MVLGLPRDAPLQCHASHWSHLEVIPGAHERNSEYCQERVQVVEPEVTLNTGLDQEDSREAACLTHG